MDRNNTDVSLEPHGTRRHQGGYEGDIKPEARFSGISYTSQFDTVSLLEGGGLRQTLPLSCLFTVTWQASVNTRERRGEAARWDGSGLRREIFCHVCTCSSALLSFLKHSHIFQWDFSYFKNVSERSALPSRQSSCEQPPVHPVSQLAFITFNAGRWNQIFI